MNVEAAIQELARRQLALEKRISDLEAPATIEVELPEFPGASSPAGSGGPHEQAEGEPDTTTPQPGDEAPRAMWVEGGELVFAPPTEDQRKLRQRLVPQLGFEHWRITTPEQGGEGSVPLPPDEATKAYLTGGPLWLVHYDRTFVLSLRPEVREYMVQDINLVDPEAAHELARDILKDESIGLSADEAVERDKQWRSHHGGGTGAERARGGNIGE